MLIFNDDDEKRTSFCGREVAGRELPAVEAAPVLVVVTAVSLALPKGLGVTAFAAGLAALARVALHVALAAPERVSRVVLVSSTAGIARADDRLARTRADDALADDLEQRPFTELMDRWQAQPVFAEDPPEVHTAMRAEQQRNDPVALAAVLRGIGTGAMTPLWDRLGELEMPVTVLVGERDGKFHAPGRRMVELLAHGELMIVPGGHRLPLENPRAVADVLSPPA